MRSYTSTEVEQQLNMVASAQGRVYLTQIEAWRDYITSSPDIGAILADLLVRTSLVQTDRIDPLVLALFYRPHLVAREKLEELLSVDSFEISKEDIVETLGSIASPLSIHALAKVLTTDDEYGHMHVKVVWVLGKIGGHDACSILKRFATHPLSNVVQAAHEE